MAEDITMSALAAAMAASDRKLARCSKLAT
jgi:hypothetical protein